MTLLWRGTAPTLVERNILSQEQVDDIAKRLKELVNTDPPLEISWKYKTIVAQKDLNWLVPSSEVDMPLILDVYLVWCILYMFMCLF